MSRGKGGGSLDPLVHQQQYKFSGDVVIFFVGFSMHPVNSDPLYKQ